MTLEEKEIHVDIYAFRGSNSVAIEVKYRTKPLKNKIDNEDYNLKNQGAYPQSRYGFINDISRLEKTVKYYKNSHGIAIFLTNDETYWKVPKNKSKTTDENFRIDENRTINGNLSWEKAPAAGTIKKREKPIFLEFKYKLKWKNYSHIANELNGKFRYLLIDVHNTKGE